MYRLCLSPLSPGSMSRIRTGSRFRVRIATPFQDRSPFQTAWYPAFRIASAGKSACAHFNSCRQTTSGAEVSSHRRRLGRRRLTLLMLKVAIRTAVKNTSRGDFVVRSSAPQPIGLSWPGVSKARQQIRQEGAQIVPYREASRIIEHVLGKASRQNTCRLRSRLDARFRVVRRVADHDRLRSGGTELAQRDADEAGVGLSVLEVVAAGGCRDEVVGVQ